MAMGRIAMPSGDAIPVNDLRRGWIASSDDVRLAIARVMVSGRYVHGPEHAAFEQELAAYLGVRYAAGVASGTDALVLALLAVGCEAGSEVVTAANAGGYTSVAAAQIGARVAYADVDEWSLLMTPETVARSIGPTTRAVVVTHLYGNVADVEGIVNVCREQGIRVIEDCAQAIGGVRGGVRAGAMGDAATFSFYPTKNLGGLGDSGAVVTNSPDIDARVRSLRQYGWGSRYHVDRPSGRNSRLDEVQAAVLRVGLRQLDGLNERRRELVRRYRSMVQGTGIQIVTGNHCETVAHLAVARVPNRERLRAALHGALVGTDVHYPVPDHRQRGLPPPARVNDLSVTERAIREIITVPCFPDLSEDEVSRVGSVLAEYGSDQP